MINKKTVLVLGAGASCPYGYPSGARLRELICLDEGFWQSYGEYLRGHEFGQSEREKRSEEVNRFRKIFKDSYAQSIDVFIANNPKLAPIGKYIIAYEVFRSERRSLFGEQAKIAQESFLSARELGRFGPRDLLSQPLFLGGDWYFYLYNRLVTGLVGKNTLPDFSNSNLAFITFNYDRSLEQFLYEGLSNLFTEVSEPDIIKCLKELKILHVYGQIAPLKWQDPKQSVDYKPKIGESLLERAAANIKTIYEQKESPELNEVRQLLAQAEQIFFLGFGYAEENLEILKLPDRTKRTTEIYGTTFELEIREKFDIHSKIKEWLPVESTNQVTIGHVNSAENMDCLKLLRNYFQ